MKEERSDILFRRLYPDKLIFELANNSYQYLNKKAKYPKLLFLCGKKSKNDETSNREWITDFFLRQDKSIVCILAEALWERESNNKKLDLLTYEDFLAEASDAILLFLESYGTACELGAFTIKESLIKKLIIFNDNKFRNEKSFINEGPIKKVMLHYTDNVIFTDLEEAIFSNPNVYSKLNNIVMNEKKIKINRDPNNVKINAFIVEVLELIALLGPITQQDLIIIYKTIKNFHSRFEFTNEQNERINIPLQYIFNLLVTSGLLIMNDGRFSYNDNLERINFMLYLDNFRFSSLRSKFLARKFKYDKQSVLVKEDLNYGITG